jgi:hypothetical protein
MPKDQRDILEVLRFELNFLEQGGYERSIRTPWKWASTFEHSPTCPNFNKPERPYSCTDCQLIDLVPVSARGLDVPCHQIPIGPRGETVSTMEQEHDLLELEEALGNWLRATINDIEQRRIEVVCWGLGLR